MTNMKERRAKLVTALRSGDYKQGQRKLRSYENKFCCLGVACDLYDSTKWEKIQSVEYNLPDDELASAGYRFNKAFDTSTSLMTVDTMKYYGFNDPGGDFLIEALSDKLKKKLHLHLPGHSHFLDDDDNKPYTHTLRSDRLALSTINDQGIQFDLIADIIESEPEGMFSS